MEEVDRQQKYKLVSQSVPDINPSTSTHGTQTHMTWEYVEALERKKHKSRSLVAATVHCFYKILDLKNPKFNVYYTYPCFLFFILYLKMEFIIDK